MRAWQGAGPRLVHAPGAAAVAHPSRTDLGVEERHLRAGTEQKPSAGTDGIATGREPNFVSCAKAALKLIIIYRVRYSSTATPSRTRLPAQDQGAPRTKMFTTYIMKPFLYLLPLAMLLGFGTAHAQPASEAQRQQQRNESYLREHERMQARSQSNTPYRPMTVDVDAARELVESWQKRNKWYAEQEKQRLANSDRLLAAERKAEAAENARRNAYMSEQRARYRSNLPAAELDELLRLGYFYYVNNKTADTRYQSAAFAAYARFDRDSATASFETLRELAGQVRGAFPVVARRCYRTLGHRFPAQRYQVEGDELLNMAYFFGALRPELHPRLTAYPTTQYEAAPEVEQADLLYRFQELSRTHPALASSAAGLCRPHLNPYALLGARWQQQGRLDSAAACYFRALRTSHDPAARPNVAADQIVYWRNYADLRLLAVARWLVAQCPQQVRSLSADDWRRISEAQALPVDLIAWVFREDDYDPEDMDQLPYWRRFPALKQARKAAN